MLTMFSLNFEPRRKMPWSSVCSYYDLTNHTYMSLSLNRIAERENSKIIKSIGYLGLQ